MRRGELPTGETHTYAHLSEVRYPGGTVVLAGEPFALTGATGHVSGPHPHCGVRPPQVHYVNGFDGCIE